MSALEQCRIGYLVTAGAWFDETTLEARLEDARIAGMDRFNGSFSLTVAPNIAVRRNAKIFERRQAFCNPG